MEDGQGRLKARHSTQEGMEEGAVGGPVLRHFIAASTICLDNSGRMEYTKDEFNILTEKRMTKSGVTMNADITGGEMIPPSSVPTTIPKTSIASQAPMPVEHTSTDSTSQSNQLYTMPTLQELVNGGTLDHETTAIAKEPHGASSAPQAAATSIEIIIYEDITVKSIMRCQKGTRE